MSYANYESAKKVMSQLDDFSCTGGISDEAINECETKIGVKFSKQARDFYKTFNYADFGENEVYGISTEFSGVYVGDSIATTLDMREKGNMNEAWVPFYEYGIDGIMACFDYSSLNDEKEPKIIAIQWNGEKYIKTDELSEDFGDFLFKLVSDFNKEEDDGEQKQNSNKQVSQNEVAQNLNRKTHLITAIICGVFILIFLIAILSVILQ